MIGVATTLGSIFALYVITIIGRRKILVGGHLLMSLAHGAVVFFNMEHMNYGVLGSIIAFKMIYEMSSGPVAWLYAAETTQDVALGFCLLNLYGVVFILSIVCPIIMAKVGENPMFIAFSGISLIGATYSFFMIKETMGLTDKQKKLLFTPKKYLTDEEVSKEREF